MRVSSEAALKLWTTIEKARAAVNVDDTVFSELMGVSRKEYRLRRDVSDPITIDELITLSEFLNVSMEDLVRGNLDYAGLTAYHCGDFTYIPERYTEAAFSKKRTSINILSFLERNVGSDFKRSLLRSLRVHENVFRNPDEKINLRFLMDLTQELVKRHYEDEDFFQMGVYSSVVNRSSELGRLMAKQSDGKGVYSLAFDHLIHRYDENFDYQIISLSDTNVSIRSFPRTMVQDGLKLKRLGTRATCVARDGVAASFIRYIGLPTAKSTKSHCIHQGDSYCQFNYEFAPLPATQLS